MRKTYVVLALLALLLGVTRAQDAPGKDTAHETGAEKKKTRAAAKPAAKKDVPGEKPAEEKGKFEASRKTSAKPKPAAPGGASGAKKRAPGLSTKWLGALKWRSIGPANMGGRITALAVNPKDKSMWWVGTASGGLLKTSNNGSTFEHLFQHQKTSSIGDVAVAASDPNVVWIGTGENNPRNSVSWGDGVYKSMDGGKTFKHMGLKASFQIGAIRIHPQNPDVVYVGALGRLWGPNGQRGLFKTTDGGKTWKKILFVDEKTGVIDIALHPKDPNTLLVATWERERDGFDTNDPAKRWGPGSGLFRSTDGGATFKRITQGLPSVDLGRIGLCWSVANPDHVYLVLDSKIIGEERPNAPYMGILGQDADAGAKLVRIVKGGPAEKAGLKTGDIVLRINGETIHSYNDLLRLVRTHDSGSKIKMEVSRARKGELVELTLGTRPRPAAPSRGGGKTAAKESKGTDGKKKEPPKVDRRRGSPFAAFLGGQRANLQEQQGNEGHQYGGIYRSADGGETWTRINSLNPRPMYFSEIRVDPNNDDHLWVLGVRLWKSKDGGKTFTNDGHDRRVHVDHHDLWIDPSDSRHMILGNDGGIYVTYDTGRNWEHLNHAAIGQFYHVAVGPRRDYKVYGGLQDNGSWGGPNRVRDDRGPTNRDWIMIGGGDGFRCRVDRNDPDLVYFESQNGGLGRRHLATGERAFLRPRPPKGQKYRFNWQTPYVLSHHNSRIYYVAGNRVFRSLDRGNGLRAISPDITRTERGSATALAESPLDPNLLYVGTDDGALWVTRDGGHTWQDAFQPAAAKKEPASPEDVKTPPITEGGHGVNGNGNGDKSDPGKKPAEAASGTGWGAELVRRLLAGDANRDGALQAEELPERRRRRFLARFDANKNGMLDKAELDGIAKMQTRPGRRPQPSADPKPRRRSVPKAKGGGRPLGELMKERRWVNWIEPSRFKAGRAYLVFDGHRSNDDRPHLFVTEDGGRTWRSLRGNLPEDAGTTRVLREDLKNPNLLYLGTEFGAWVSIDRGATWVSLHTNLPTVPVHAFALHPTAGEIVAGTHGRSLWVLDVTVLRQLSKETMGAPATLYQPKPAVQWRRLPRRGHARGFVGQNPADGAEIYFALGKSAKAVQLEITKADGSVVRTLTGNKTAGLHRVVWDLRGAPTRMGPQGQFRRPGRRVQPGAFRVVLTVDGKKYARGLQVDIDPNFTDRRWITFENEAEEREAERGGEEEERVGEDGSAGRAD